MRSSQATASRESAPRVAEAARIFAALGDETRLRIVGRLRDGGPMSIMRLADGVDVTRQAVTKHLLSLEDAGLVTSAREGRERIWEIRPERLQDAQRYLEQVSRRWDQALARLQAMVEK